jgi:hypothetical protein
VEPEKARLLHMDFHLGNVLGSMRTGGRWMPGGVIDWTWAKWGPREADFSEMGVSVCLTNPWAMEPMLVGYREISGQTLEPRGSILGQGRARADGCATSRRAIRT